MNLRMRSILSILSALIISGCNTTDNILEEGVASQNGWEEYRLTNPSPRFSERGDWNSSSAWAHPPARSNNSSVSRQEIAVERAPIKEPADLNQKPNEWVQMNVPTDFRSSLEEAVVIAHKNGRSFTRDPNTTLHYELQRVWSTGSCSEVEVVVMSDGGKLPIISRGQMQTCG